MLSISFIQIVEHDAAARSTSYQHPRRYQLVAADAIRSIYGSKVPGWVDGRLPHAWRFEDTAHDQSAWRWLVLVRRYLCGEVIGLSQLPTQQHMYTYAHAYTPVYTHTYTHARHTLIPRFRANTSLGSMDKYIASQGMTMAVGEGELNGLPSLNPHFYNFTMLSPVYCDGSNFAGEADHANITLPGGGTTSLYVRGRAILTAAIDAALEQHGLKDTLEEVMLTGCSAGGTATYFNVDFVHAYASHHFASSPLSISIQFPSPPSCCHLFACACADVRVCPLPTS